MSRWALVTAGPWSGWWTPLLPCCKWVIALFFICLAPWVITQPQTFCQLSKSLHRCWWIRSSTNITFFKGFCPVHSSRSRGSGGCYPAGSAGGQEDRRTARAKDRKPQQNHSRGSWAASPRRKQILSKEEVNFPQSATNTCWNAWFSTNKSKGDRRSLTAQQNRLRLLEKSRCTFNRILQGQSPQQVQVREQEQNLHPPCKPLLRWHMPSWAQEGIRVKYPQSL